MPPRDVSMNRRSRSPTEDSGSAVRRRSRSPLPGHRNDPSLSDNADSEKVHQTTSNPEAVPEEFRDIIKDHAKYLRHHLGLPESPGMPPPEVSGPAPLFFIEVAPENRRGGAKCKLPSCSGLIRPGTYRLALNPSMNPVSARYGNQNSDFYHIKCFEKIADFSQSDFNKRLLPLTRRFFNLRGLKGSQILDGDYFCDGGAERLVLEWKVARGRLLDARDGVEKLEDEEPISPAQDNLLNKAGSANFNHEPVVGITQHETRLLSTILAPWESDGPGDKAEWNLFDEYLVIGDVEDRHALSTTLEAWDLATFLATSSDDDLTDEMKEMKAELGEKARRGIKRLSTVPMPDLQRAFFGR